MSQQKYINVNILTLNFVCVINYSLSTASHCKDNKIRELKYFLDVTMSTYNNLNTKIIIYFV